ncbi:hypothetical protein [Nocardia pseudobrasiliensis]|uniref:Uncharacterized protein n=1 Tax=Nocardia pseudobrasiliensis TaxID=45979 RepID=A0A370I0X0_9NOCA|nr:hypothetical protein [Nocardia pseudobrasiliensis]RDI64366.1 hypothetical protein DFR76_108198 [Nocardia pseudobrasiliensis]
MRLTVTVDHDVALLLEEAVRRERRSKKRIVNDALRRALAGAEPAEPAVEPERPVPLDPHTDAPALVRAADESDEEAITVALARYFGFEPPAPRLYVVKG